MKLTVNQLRSIIKEEFEKAKKHIATKNVGDVFVARQDLDIYDSKTRLRRELIGAGLGYPYYLVSAGTSVKIIKIDNDPKKGEQLYLLADEDEEPIGWCLAAMCD
jgi:hypothetical protein